MLSPQDKERIEAEEVFRSELRDKISESKKVSKNAGCFVILAVVFFLLCVFFLTLKPSRALDPGSLISFQGVIVLAKDDYIVLSGGGLTVRCVNRSSSPAILSTVTVSGSIVEWKEEVGGVLDPCRIK